MTFSPNFDATLLRGGPVSNHILRAVYASDLDMYPAPLPYARLRSWVDACPDLSVCFRRENTTSAQPIGVVIGLPIRQPHWDDLLHRGLEKTDIDPDVAFPPQDLAGLDVMEEKVGLHVFHIERFLRVIHSQQQGGGPQSSRWTRSSAVHH